MGAQVDIRDNFKQLERQLSNIQRSQLPFATANAINSTLFDGRRFALSLWKQKMAVKNRGFASYAYRVSKATKHRRTGTLFDRSGRNILELQAQGGRAVPYNSEHFAVPTRSALTATGRIKKAANLRLQRDNKNIFKATIRGRLGIWQRYGQEARQIRLLYILKPHVTNKALYPFYPRMEKIIKRVFPGHFNSSMERALRTAYR